MALRLLVADDEPMARQRVRRILEAETETVIVGEASDGSEAVQLIRQHDPDVVFLDIRMPRMNGFEVIERIGPGRMPLVVFITAYDDHAVDAFEVNAVDYVLKPFDPNRLRAALGRARSRLSEENDAERGRRVSALLRDLEERAAGGTPADRPDRIAVKSRGRISFVRVEDIDWVEAAGNYVRLHVGDDTRLIRQTLTAIEERLDPNRFVRIHRSHLVNLDRVVEMRHWSSGEYVVELRDGTELKLSRTYRDRILERLDRLEARD